MNINKLFLEEIMNPYLGEFEGKIVEAVKLAGVELMKRWPGNTNSNHELKIETKSDGSKVTDADFTSNEIIVGCIKECFPEDLIFSEEMPPPDGAKDSERVWVIDPLDGTHPFIAGRDDFSILVALCSKGVPQFSIAYHPAQEKFMQATRGLGMFLNGTKVSVSKADKIGQGKLYVDSLKNIDSNLAFSEPHDSGFVLTSICRGTLDGAFIVLRNHKEWDLAAPALLIKESGGRVTNERGEEILYYPGSIDYKIVVASNGKVHGEMLGLLVCSD